MITLRLDSKLEKTLENTAKSIGMTKSEFVRKSILNYLKRIPRKTPWELGNDLFANYSSGQKNLSENVSRVFKNKIKVNKI
jgi:RHH-type rel operon transcriptional repressor/antitoxin RelB